MDINMWDVDDDYTRGPQQKKEKKKKKRKRWPRLPTAAIGHPDHRHSLWRNSYFSIEMLRMKKKNFRRDSFFFTRPFNQKYGADFDLGNIPFFLLVCEKKKNKVGVYVILASCQGKKRDENLSFYWRH